MNAFRSGKGNAARDVDFLPPEPTARRTLVQRNPADVEDAQFEVVAAGARRAAKPVFNDNRRMSAAVSPPSFGKRKPPVSRVSRAVLWAEQMLRTASPKGFAILVTCLCAPIFALFAVLPRHHGATLDLSAPSMERTASIPGQSGVRIFDAAGSQESRSIGQFSPPPAKIEVISGGRGRAAGQRAQTDARPALADVKPITTRLPYAGGKVPGVTVSFGK